MNRKIYHVQLLMSFLPFLGFLVVIFWSWGYIKKITKKSGQIFLHFLICLIPFVGIGILFLVLVYFIYIPIINLTFKMTLILATGYICYVIMGLISAFVEKKIIEKHELNDRN